MLSSKCRTAGLAVLLMSSAAAFAPASLAALSNYSQDFEGMTPNQGYPPNDLSADGWQIFGIVWDADPRGAANQQYAYGPFDAANGDPGSIQGVATGEGGPAQGDVVLNKYTDYLNQDQPSAYIQTLTVQTQTVEPGDVGPWRFTYDAKIGNLEGTSSAFAYIQTVDPISFFQKGFVSNDTTNLPVEWGAYSLDLLIDSALVGDILTFGFSATATNYEGSAVFYDNLNFFRVPLPAAAWLFPTGLIAGLTWMRRRRA